VVKPCVAFHSAYFVGCVEGTAEGDVVGTLEGRADGVVVGTEVGMIVGVYVGNVVGTVGAFDGANVGIAMHAELPLFEYPPPPHDVQTAADAFEK
jgi:hypothetical protein